MGKKRRKSRKPKVTLPEVICPYCGSKASLVDSSVVYARSYGKLWLCDGHPKCDARVGCHRSTGMPLGTLANASLRDARKKAHAMLDPFWKRAWVDRQMLYGQLAIALDISTEECHIAMFDEAMCAKVVEICEQWIEEGRFRD